MGEEGCFQVSEAAVVITEMSKARANFSSPIGGVMASEILCGFYVVWGEATGFVRFKL